VNNESSGNSCCAREQTTQSAVFQPTTDIFETQNEIVILADVPGATAGGLDLDFADGVLSVRATIASRKESQGRPILSEYGVGDFERSFRIGTGIDTGRIKATVDAGLLTITLPKAEGLRPRKISVQAPGTAPRRTDGDGSTNN
jgi:HSP20 family molecular chaperone IbpA